MLGAILVPGHRGLEEANGVGGRELLDNRRTGGTAALGGAAAATHVLARGRVPAPRPPPGPTLPRGPAIPPSFPAPPEAPRGRAARNAPLAAPGSRRPCGSAGRRRLRRPPSGFCKTPVPLGPARRPSLLRAVRTDPLADAPAVFDAAVATGAESRSAPAARPVPSRLRSAGRPPGAHLHRAIPRGSSLSSPVALLRSPSLPSAPGPEQLAEAAFHLALPARHFGPGLSFSSAQGGNASLASPALTALTAPRRRCGWDEPRGLPASGTARFHTETHSSPALLASGHQH